MYRQSLWPEKPDTIKNEQDFHKMIRSWVRIEDNCGIESLKPKTTNKVWSPDEKYELIAKVLAGCSIKETAYSVGISSGMLCQWLQKYKISGYNGLVNKKTGRPCKEPDMKKTTDSSPITESEREELIRLRAENEYIKTEIEVIKKRIALRHEKQAAQLKAKKQQSLKSYEKKDSN
jgi:transposase-like protein